MAKTSKTNIDNTTATKMTTTASVLGGAVFFANDNGQDPEYPEYGDLLPNGMYIRIENTDGSFAYISAYEIDKAIQIIGDMSMSKASSADVETLASQLDTKASKNDLDLLQSDIYTKASKIDLDNLSEVVEDKADKTEMQTISETLNQKADKTDLDDLTDTINDKADKVEIQTISETLNQKANTDTVIAMVKDIEALKEALNNVSSNQSIVAIKNQIDYLRSEVNKRLTIDDLSPINTNITNLSSEITDIDARLTQAESNIQKKANTVYVQGQVTELNNAITGLAKRVDTKADKTTVNLKADRSELDPVIKKVATLSTSVSDVVTSTTSKLNEFETSIATKADKSDVTTSINKLTEDVSLKADKTTLNDAISNINNKLLNLEENHSDDISTLIVAIDDVECEVNSNIAEINAIASGNTKRIDNQAKQITSLQEADRKFEEKLKTEWVRVMTPEEYKKLPPIGSTYGDGKPNPYAKQPNVIYMLVRFNQPISVYIGDVLIAQAEEKGDVGFVYKFPIVF